MCFIFYFLKRQQKMAQFFPVDATFRMRMQSSVGNKYHIYLEYASVHCDVSIQRFHKWFIQSPSIVYKDRISMPLAPCAP